MSVLDDYLVDPKLSLLDKTRIQAQVLVPVLLARRNLWAWIHFQIRRNQEVQCRLSAPPAEWQLIET